MRVLESKQPGPQVYAMGKKKHKLRKQKRDVENGGSESSDDSNAIAGNNCKHINKGVNINALRKTLKQINLGKCQECADSPAQNVAEKVEGSMGAVGGSDSNPEPTTETMAEASPTVWLCLQCGHQGCGRYSEGTHGLKHYRTPHSAPHSLSMNPENASVWCYTCDDVVEVSSSKRLQECVDLVNKAVISVTRADIPQFTGKRTGSHNSTGGSVADVETTQPTVSDTKKELKRPRSGAGSQASQSLTEALTKVRGLSNLGNTCFFNAVMQNLSQTQLLETQLEECAKSEPLHLASVSVRLGDGEEQGGSEEASGSSSSSSEDEDDKKTMLDPLVLSVGECGRLTQSLLSFLRDMNGNSRNSTLSPSVLFGQVCQKAPRFKGFQQQDSHELLRHLLDGMRAEEIKRRQHGILKEFNLTDTSNRKNIDVLTRMKIKAYGKQAKSTFVDNIFGGYFVSTVLCEECNIPSQIYESFLDISLPITEEKPARPNINQLGGRGKTVISPGVSKPAGEPVVKPSKHALKKQRKEEKRKARHSKTKTSHVKPDTTGVDVKEESMEGEAAGGADQASLEGKTQAEEDNVSRDADIEDNIEGDLSRNRYHINGETVSALTNGSLEDIHASPVFLKMSGSHLGSQCDSLGGDERTGAGECSSEDSTLKGSVGTATSSDVSSRTKVDTESSLCSSETLESLNGAQSSASHRDSGLSSLENVTQGVRTLQLSGEEDAHEPHVLNGFPDNPMKMQNNTSESAARTGVMQNSRRALCIEAQRTARTPLAPRYKPGPLECSVMSCLKQFTTAELLTDNNRFRCEHCTKCQGKKEAVYTNANKQLLIIRPPPILTLHMKRFQQVGFGLRKVNRHVQFPMMLDIAPFCSLLSQGVPPGQHQVLYALYGVVEHSGRLSGGHYTAYVKVRSNHSQQAQKFITTTDLSATSTNIDKLIETMQSMASVSDRHDAVSTDAEGGLGRDLADDLVPPGKWYYISDSRVNEVSNEANVLRCQAYLLFYERIL